MKCQIKLQLLQPKGTFYIIAAEMAERFSIGGFTCIFMVFMTQYLFDNQGNHEFTGPQAMVWYHNFMAAATFFSVIGAIAADALLGRYKAIIIFAIIYNFGYLTLVFFDSRSSLAYSLILIAIGLGGIVSCFASHLGDQFGRKNRQQISQAYSWFWFAIAIGTSIATFLMPYLLEKFGPKIAFITMSLSLSIAVMIFYKGRKVFVTIPPIGWQRYLKEFQDKDNLKAIGNLAIIFTFTIFLHAVHEQSMSLWAMQAGEMNREINLGFFKLNLLQSQIELFEYTFISILIPLFSYVIYPFFEKFTRVTYLKKIAVAFFIAAASFAILAYAQSLIEQGREVGVIWQIVAYVLLSIEQMLIVATSFEVSYTHSPRSMKSTGLALYFLSISFGNLLISMVNSHFQDAQGHLTIALSTYFAYFSYATIVVGLLFIIYAPFYKGRVFLQIDTIKEILEVILDAGRKRIALIALCGSYANRNNSEDLDVIRDIKYKHDDSYNFLIVTRERQGAGLNEIGFLSNLINSELIKQGLSSITLSRINNNVKFDFTSIHSLKTEIGQKISFAEFKKEMIFLYKLSGFRLEELLEYSKEKAQLVTTEDYQDYYNNGLHFLDSTKNNIKDASARLAMVAFQLHQATEQFYHCCLLALAGHRPRFHKLEALNSLLCSHLNQFSDIFPANNREQKECFELLENAYLARYTSRYKINTKQLNYLITRVEVLKDLTKEICEKRSHNVEIER
jgi:POT family proton-dependent oligopeptide transporter